MEPLSQQYAHPDDLSQAERDNHALQNTAPLPKRLYRGRPGVVVLTALIVEILVIAGLGNQGVSKQLQDYLANHPGAADYTVGAVRAALTFHWRFTAANGEPTHTWAAQFAAIGTLLVLSALLIWVVSRGSVTFGRIWVSAGAVIAAVTPIAVMVGNAIIVPTAPGPGQSRLGQAVYGFTGYGPVIVAGVSLGVVAGLLCGLLAVITRRTVALPVAVVAPVEGSPVNAYGVPTPGYEPPPWGAPEAAAAAAATAYIAPIDELPANRGPLDHLGASESANPYAPTAVPVAAVEPPVVTTAESAAIDAPTQSMHIEMTQPEIVLAEDAAPAPAESLQPAQELEATAPPVPPEELEATAPPVPPEELEATQPPVPPERLSADDTDDIELDERTQLDASQEESTDS